MVGRHNISFVAATALILLAQTPNAANAAAPQLPKICAKLGEYTTCTNNAAFASARCNVDNVNSDGTTGLALFNCLCETSKVMLRCFDLCPDSPELQLQRQELDARSDTQCAAAQDLKDRGFTLEPTPSPTPTSGNNGGATGGAGPTTTTDPNRRYVGTPIVGNPVETDSPTSAPAPTRTGLNLSFLNGGVKVSGGAAQPFVTVVVVGMVSAMTALML
ncbi:hypothetical protein HK102_009451 [Quaeritorhiza haematococci]|nr:hypothetical protein HK102_009451 [Quaeritorhiza haematococci]